MRDPFVLIYKEDGEVRTKEFADHDDLTRFMKQDGIEYLGCRWPDWTKVKKRRKKNG